MNRASRTARARRWTAAAAAAALCAGLAACGDAGKDDATGASPSVAGSSKSASGHKLILMEMSFPCGLNEGISKYCEGAKAAKLPAGYELQIKTGVDIADNTAFNNLIQTSLELKPAGLIVFPAGPAAQTPTLNRACDQGVKIIILDSPAEGVKCQSALVGMDHTETGALVGRWLAEHAQGSKEVGIVTQPPGQFTSTDNRVKGFKKAAEAGGLKVVATAVTDITLDKTRTQVTNMLTAHPDIGAIFSANGPMGQGTTQALKAAKAFGRIAHVTLDFDSTNVKQLKAGELSAVTNEHPFEIGRIAVETMVKVLEGESVPATVTTPQSVVDKTNVDQAAGTD
jgi:ABC-type sugar transport system substrate-binding protein